MSHQNVTASPDTNSHLVLQPHLGNDRDDIAGTHPLVGDVNTDLLIKYTQYRVQMSCIFFL